MATVYLDPEADEALQALLDDPLRVELARRVSTTLDQLEADPGAAAMRRHRFQTVGLWCVFVTGDDETWALLWESLDDQAATAAVRYLEPASFD